MDKPTLVRRIVRDPLTHFLIIGLGFILFDLASEKARADVIIVTDDRLAVWLQYRNKAFSPDAAGAMIATLPTDKKQRLIDDFTAEEALYREALALGLDRNDAVLRQRLIQKMDYVLLGLSDANSPPDEAQIEAYFQAHQDRYAIPPHVTLSHIYFKDGPGARAKADAALAAIDAGQDAPRGERFLYHRTYVEAQKTLLADHLGEAVAAASFDPATPVGVWTGPVRSAYGWHLIRLVRRAQTRAPALAEVAPQVAADWQRDRIAELRRTTTRRLVDKYTIRVEP